MTGRCFFVCLGPVVRQARGHSEFRDEQLEKKGLLAPWCRLQEPKNTARGHNSAGAHSVPVGDIPGPPLEAILEHANRVPAGARGCQGSNESGIAGFSACRGPRSRRCSAEWPPELVLFGNAEVSFPQQCGMRPFPTHGYDRKQTKEAQGARQRIREGNASRIHSHRSPGPIRDGGG